MHELWFSAEFNIPAAERDGVKLTSYRELGGWAQHRCDATKPGTTFLQSILDANGIRTEDGM